MNTDDSKKLRDGKTERRKSKRPRRRLVDLTLPRGSNKRERKEDRRKATLDETTERLGELAKKKKNRDKGQETSDR